MHHAVKYGPSKADNSFLLLLLSNCFADHCCALVPRLLFPVPGFSNILLSMIKQMRNAVILMDIFNMTGTLLVHVPVEVVFYISAA